MALDDFLEISDFVKIFFQFMIILFDNFFTEIVAESFDEGQNSMVEFVSIFEALHLSKFFERLQHDPAFTQLSFQKLAPKHQSEESLIF